MTKVSAARNWSKYNKALVQRGSITLWIDKKSLHGWYAKHKKNPCKGRPDYFGDASIQCLLTLKSIYHLSLRATQGFAESLMKLMKADLEILSYTQLCRRQKRVVLPALPVSSKPIYMVVDSTGLKVYGEGEWKVRQHGYSKHREWMKLHIGVDEASQLIVSAKLSDNHSGDHKHLDTLLSSYRGKIEKVGADAGYDYHESYDIIEKYDAEPVIAPNINPRHPRKRLNTLRWDKSRDIVRWLQEQLGVTTWKIAEDYHRRSLVETAFYRYKQLLGGTLAARTADNQRTEALLKCHILNTITRLGIPTTL
jgi:transposase